MGVKFKLLAACTAVCAVATAVCFAAYIPQISRSFGASVFGEGVNAAQSYMSLSVTPPSGDEGGISPLVLDYAIDCAALAANVGAERVTLTAVVRYADGVPFALEHIYLPGDLFEGINPWELENSSMIRIMEEEFHIEIAYSTQTLNPKVPTAQQAELLELKSRKPLLAISSDIVNKGLKAMDATAATMCMENDIPVLAFALGEKDSILRAVCGEKLGTLISNE